MKHLIISQIETGGTISQGKLYGIPNEIYNQVITLLNDNSIIEAGHELDDTTDDESKIKSFEEVQIGDIAYHTLSDLQADEPEGRIVWKGNSELLKIERPKDLEQMEDDEIEDMDWDYYNQWVVVEVPIYGETLYNYRIDPSGVKVFK